MNDNTLYGETDREKVEISVHLDSELVEKIRHLTNDPSRIIELALKQWLRGEKAEDNDLTRRLRRNPPVPPRGEWND
ncbi:MAG: type II toxin-antitoxin system CcdA family antitoxin [Geminocystis sp.]|nr:type II toxin-antitoxin system CcdA family antitoxin [Geminocystis sp.]HIK36680.1 type II toxin-antitoxin system CcdA family antitoxin [Geminocystis sp. M7585_C2015_104]MCS7148484.1 type II toxin-antitoxin system CcdA family antitoxin [Geminocystis sp.]MCX8079440.1 type II toxin-antitoxin system CcdA family antitoxin [Geminocystis sp.]MDW8114942.1 type II toxin-antitoxin system CcdA family antitoxin [Geminocystis sp.]